MTRSAGREISKEEGDLRLMSSSTYVGGAVSVKKIVRGDYHRAIVITTKCELR